jgi:hypothetical protein
MQRISPLTTISVCFTVIAHCGVIYLLGQDLLKQSAITHFASSSIPINISSIANKKSSDTPSRVIENSQQAKISTDFPTASDRQQSVNSIYYFKSTQVTQRPSVLIDLPADFALPAPLSTTSSSIQMTLLINENGGIDDVLLNDEQFDVESRQIIIRTFKSMYFNPAFIGHIRVPSEVRIEVFPSIP